MLCIQNSRFDSSTSCRFMLLSISPIPLSSSLWQPPFYSILLQVQFFPSLRRPASTAATSVPPPASCPSPPEAPEALTQRGAALQDQRRPGRGEEGGQQRAADGQHASSSANAPCSQRDRRAGREPTAGAGRRAGSRPEGSPHPRGARAPHARRVPEPCAALGSGPSGRAQCQCDFPLAHDSTADGPGKAGKHLRNSPWSCLSAVPGCCYESRGGWRNSPAHRPSGGGGFLPQRRT